MSLKVYEAGRGGRVRHTLCPPGDALNWWHPENIDVEPRHTQRYDTNGCRRGGQPMSSYEPVADVYGHRITDSLNIIEPFPYSWELGLEEGDGEECLADEDDDESEPETWEDTVLRLIHTHCHHEIDETVGEQAGWLDEYEIVVETWLASISGELVHVALEDYFDRVSSKRPEEIEKSPHGRLGNRQNTQKTRKRWSRDTIRRADYFAVNGNGRPDHDDLIDLAEFLRIMSGNGIDKSELFQERFVNLYADEIQAELKNGS
jgi:hypothetical protein